MDKLEEMMLEYRGKKFVVIEPGGNNGDRLIYMGMEKKLKELGINYKVLQYRENPRFYLLHTIYFGPWKRILKIPSVAYKSSNGLGIAVNKLDSEVYGQTLRADKIQVDPAHLILTQGGGNIDDLYGFGIRLLKNIIQHSRNRVIIVGPQTYWFKWTHFPELFLTARQEVHLFCRERYSYNLLRSLSFPENVHVDLSPDTAFYLSKKDFQARLGAYDLICFRTDRESLMFQKTRDLDLSQETGPRDLRKSQKRVFVGDISLLPKFREFLELIEGSRKVCTDRLHVAILAAILGKDTTLYSNSYYKNKGVYEYSLSSYPNVKFVDIQKISARSLNV
jgi:exopolysaccharide biosynthesis predicted pyruvyltransferase EpsI